MKAWVRIDADVFAHPKFVGISPATFVAWVKGLGHCRQFRTDGTIAANVVSTIARKKVREELLERELWHERSDGGVDVHGYAEYQLTEAHWQAKSAAGKKGAEARWGMAPAMATASDSHSRSHATAIATDSDTDTDTEKPSSGAARRKHVWQALNELLGPAASRSRDWGKRHKSVSDLVVHDATPELIHRAYHDLEKLWPDAERTDMALATHYPQIAHQFGYARNGDGPEEGAT